MKLECGKTILQRAIATVERVTGKKLALTVLGKIILEVKGRNLFVRATNLDMAVEMRVRAKADQDGQVAISGPVLEAHLSNLPETNIFIETTNESLILKTANSSARVATESADEFPTFNQERKGGFVHYVIPSVDLVNAIRSVSYAASTSEIKPELSSVLIFQRDWELVFVATDSFRLAEKRVVIDKKLNKEKAEFSALLPGRTAVELVRIFDNVLADVEVVLYQDEIVFKSEDIFVSGRLVAGNFPPYETIIPKSSSTQVVVSRDELVSALRLATVFSDKFSQVSLRVIPEDHLFEVGGKAQDRGEASARVDATTEGLAVDIRLNAKYFLDCLSSLKGGDVTVGFNGGDKAMVVRHSGDRSFLYLLMPLNH